MVDGIFGAFASQVQPACAGTTDRSFREGPAGAGGLGPAQRKRLSFQALGSKMRCGAGSESITHLAARHGVSRKFIYEQADKASAALDEAFAPALRDDREVLFHVPVTKDWIRQFVLAQVLIGHSSFRGVLEMMDAVFDYRGVSIGTVHNIVREAIAKARDLNAAQDLSGVRPACAATADRPESPSIPSERPTGARREKPSRNAQRPRPSTLAPTPRLPALPSQLILAAPPPVTPQPPSPDGTPPLPPKINRF